MVFNLLFGKNSSKLNKMGGLEEEKVFKSLNEVPVGGDRDERSIDFTN